MKYFNGRDRGYREEQGARYSLCSSPTSLDPFEGEARIFQMGSLKPREVSVKNHSFEFLDHSPLSGSLSAPRDSPPPGALVYVRGRRVLRLEFHMGGAGLHAGARRVLLSAQAYPA